MSNTETRTIRDPFLGKNVEVSSKLTDRLRGRYASGPPMENGEPEFGWRTYEVPPIQREAADEIERLQRGWYDAVEAAVKIAKAHRGAAARKRKERGESLKGFENRDEIIAEERGEDIASEIIARDIRALEQRVNGKSDDA